MKMKFEDLLAKIEKALSYLNEDSEERHELLEKIDNVVESYFIKTGKCRHLSDNESLMNYAVERIAGGIKCKNCGKCYYRLLTSEEVKQIIG